MKKTVLEIIIFGSEIPKQKSGKKPRIVPRCFRLNHFAVFFRISGKGSLYVVYLTIFTAVALYRKDGKPPFPTENFLLDHLCCVGEILSVFGALIFLYKMIEIINNFCRNPPNFRVLSIDGFNDIVFFLQAALLICVIMYGCGQEEYVGLLVQHVYQASEDMLRRSFSLLNQLCWIKDASKTSRTPAVETWSSPPMI